MPDQVSVVVKKGIFSKLSGLFKHGFLIIFILIVVSQAIIIAINSQDPVYAIKEIGGRIFFATDTLSKESLFILEQGSVYNDSLNTLDATWQLIKTYSKIFEAIYSIIIWIKVLMLVVAWLPISGESARNTINLSLSVFIFFMAQMLFLALFPPDNLTAFEALRLPFSAFKDLWHATPILVAPVTEVINKITDNSGTVNNSVVSAINTTNTTL